MAVCEVCQAQECVDVYFAIQCILLVLVTKMNVRLNDVGECHC